MSDENKIGLNNQIDSKTLACILRTEAAYWREQDNDTQDKTLREIYGSIYSVLINVANALHDRSEDND